MADHAADLLDPAATRAVLQSVRPTHLVWSVEPGLHRCSPRLRTELGFVPRDGLAEGIADVVAGFQG